MKLKQPEPNKFPCHKLLDNSSWSMTTQHGLLEKVQSIKYVFLESMNCCVLQ